MKKIQKFRLLSQILFLVIISFSLMTKFNQTMLVILTATILGGAFYCGWICPFGFLQDLMSKLGSLLKIKKVKMPKSIHRIAKYSRFILALASALITADFIFTLLSKDPRVNLDMFLSNHILSITAGIIILAFAILSMFFDRFFCNYLCVQGAKYGLFSFLRPFTIKRDHSKCVNCKKCDKVCPMNLEISTCNNLRSANCVNCFNCISSCPVDKTLKYGVINLKNENKIMYFSLIGMVCSVLIFFALFSKLNAADTTITSSISSSEVSNLDNNEDKDYAWGWGKKRGHHGSSTISEDSVTYTAEGIKNGEYQGSGTGFRGTTKLSVAIENEKIVNISVDSYRDDRKWFSRALAVIDNILDKQSTDVDLIAGATYSSIGIKNAVNDALKTADKK